MAKPKYKSPYTNDEFLSKAENIAIMLDGVPVQGDVKKFKSGSVGLCYTGPVTLMVAGKPVKFQASINLTVFGSKPKDAEDAEDAENAAA